MRLRHLLGLVGSAALALVATTARDARACGGCFQPPSQSGDVITDEKMIFRITPQATTLYDEIEYSGSPQSFGWVLPIRGTVTVGLSSDILFSSLDTATKTTIYGPNLPSCPSCGCYNGGAAAPGGSGSGSSSGGGVTVLSQQTVGPYDTVQLASTNPTALNDWLSANGYVVPSGFQPTIAAYVSEGYDFLALKLAPGQGVSAMRPVRVTTPGAGVQLPLRMVAAGTGATVGVTVWVVSDGRYEPSNMAHFTIDASELTWDFSTSQSNYTTVRQGKEAAGKFATWQIESSIDVAAYQIEGPVLADAADQDYLPTGDADAGSGGETADQVRSDDLATFFPGGDQSSVRVTRMRADLAHTALATDLIVQPSADQSQLSNSIYVTNAANAPTCPPVQDPCPPCDYGSSTGSGGSSSGGVFGLGGTSGGSHGGGCATVQSSGGGGLELLLGGLGMVALVGSRARRRR
jgi:hypothetical protein